MKEILQKVRALSRHFAARSDARWMGQMGFSVNGGEYVWTPNRVVDQGLNYLLNAGLRGEGVVSTWYLAPFTASVTPAASLTAANFGSTLTEFTNYNEAARPTWSSAAPATSLVIENSAAPCLYTIGSGAQTAIHGGALISVAAKGATTGILLAAAKLPTALLSLADGFEVRLKYRLTGSSS